jgi:hypothetical protein
MAAQDGDLMPEGQQLEIALGLRLSVEQEDDRVFAPHRACSNITRRARTRV